MQYQEERMALGKFLFNRTKKAAEFLMKHMWLYYILNYTWGLLAVIFGWIVIGFLYIFFRKKIVNHGKFGPCHYVTIFDNWGGLELGINFILADKMGAYWTLHTKQHECGHTFQNAIYGPFAIFMVYLPSAIRYWQQTIRQKQGKSNKPYDLIWFEGSASAIGEIYYENYLSK